MTLITLKWNKQQTDQYNISLHQISQMSPIIIVQDVLFLINSELTLTLLTHSQSLYLHIIEQVNQQYIG